MDEYRFRLTQGDMIVAQGFADNFEDVQRLGYHYAFVYDSDGIPSVLQFAGKVAGKRWRNLRA